MRLIENLNVKTYNKTNKFLRKTKIFTRLFIAFLVCSVVPLVIVGYMSYEKSNQAIDNKITTYSGQVIELIKKNIETLMLKYENKASEVALSLDVQDYLNNGKKWSIGKQTNFFAQGGKFVAIIVEKFSNDKYYQGIRIYGKGIPFLEGGFRYKYEESTKIFDDLIKATDKTDGAPNWFMIDKGYDWHKVLVLTRNIKSLESGESIGSIILTFKEDMFSDIYKDINIGKGADIFVMDSDGKIISSRNLNKIPIDKKYLKDNIVKKINSSYKNNKKIIRENILGSDNLLSFSKINNTNWYIVCAVPYSYLNVESNSIKYNNIFIIIICIIMVFTISYIIAINVSNPLKELVLFMGEAEKGNLTIKIKDNSLDEIGMVNNSFSKMINNINDLIIKVRNSSKLVLESSAEIALTSNDAFSVSEMVCKSIEEVSIGASDQASFSTVSSKSMLELSNNINRVVDEMGNVFKIVKNTQKLSDNATYTVKSLSDKTILTSEITKDIVKKIREINIDMKSIEKIIKLIREISTQTKLIALNASIEAARVGEAGKGFNVIVSEVKKLADQSKKASNSINEILENLKEKTKLTVEVANNSGEIMKEQMKSVDNTDLSFKEVNNSMENITMYVNNMHESVQGMLKLKDNTLMAIDNISAVSQQTAATSEEVAESSQIQMRSSLKVSELAKLMDEMACDLDQTVTLFMTEE